MNVLVLLVVVSGRAVTTTSCLRFVAFLRQDGEFPQQSSASELSVDGRRQAEGPGDLPPSGDAWSSKTCVLAQSVSGFHHRVVCLLLLCVAQERNIFNRIFGGFLMRKAYELGWANACSYG